MKQFTYKAITQNNKRISGIVEAKDKEAAIKILKEKRLLIINISSQSDNFFYKLSLSFSKVSGSDIVFFTRQFAIMMNSGLPMIQSLNILKKKTSKAMAKVIDDIIQSIEGGSSLYEAMNNHNKIFSPIYLSLIKSGELGGVLDQVLEQLANNLEKERDFMAKVKSALFYPGIISVVMVGILIIMVFFVMPQLAELYKQFDADLPITTTLMISGSEFIRHYWFIFFFIFLLAIFAVIYFLKQSQVRQEIDKIILRLPYIGDLQDKIISTNLMRTLSLLIKSGVSIVDSLQVLSAGAGNYVYQQGITGTIRNVEKGMSLSDSFAQENFLPELVIQMIIVGEETGKIDETLAKIARQFEKESVIALKTMTNMIEPMMIIVLGIGIGVMVFSIIMPIYNLTSSF